VLYFVDDFIAPMAEKLSWSRICEIGSKYGEATDRLSLVIPDLSIDIIDTCVDNDLERKYESVERVEVLKGLSLEILPRLHGVYDAVLIDGDHNWYTRACRRDYFCT
jgi:predicted O-methyltransferase YrrM